MLALSRKKGDSIIIGDNIEIVVLGIVGEQVKIGIVAPKSIPVHRKEIYEAIKKENIKAAAINENGIKRLSDIFPSNITTEE